MNLSRRFTSYYSLDFLIKGTKFSLAYRALLKYGHRGFRLDVLEYCDPEFVLEREQYYLDLLQPEYNILNTAGSTLGYKHTEETRAILKARQFSDEYKAKLREHLARHNASEEQRAKARERMLSINEEKGVSVEVLDLETQITTTYISLRKAAEAIGCTHGAIRLAEKRFLERGINKPIKKRYVVKIDRV